MNWRAKRRQHVAKRRAAFTSCLTESDIADVVATLLKLAIGGDVAAIKLVLERAIGKPEAFTDLPDDDAGEAQIELEKITAENFDAVREHLKRRIEALRE